MSEDQLTVTFSCKSCGADPTVLELPDDHTDDSIAKCKKCGVEMGRFGDIKEKAMEVAKSEVSNMMKNAFKGVKGFTFK